MRVNLCFILARILRNIELPIKKKEILRNIEAVSHHKDSYQRMVIKIIELMAFTVKWIFKH